MASLSVQALRSQFESIATKNARRPQPINAQSSSDNSNIAIDNMANEACDDDMDDDILSSYGDSNDTEETTNVEDSPESGRSTPEHYIEIATANPYDKDNRDSAGQTGKSMEPTNTDTVTVTVTVEVPVRKETMEEALSRLSRELELAHRGIEEDQAGVLRDLLMPSR